MGFQLQQQGKGGQPLAVGQLLKQVAAKSAIRLIISPDDERNLIPTWLLQQVFGVFEAHESLSAEALLRQLLSKQAV